MYMSTYQSVHGNELLSAAYVVDTWCGIGLSSSSGMTQPFSSKYPTCKSRYSDIFERSWKKLHFKNCKWNHFKLILMHFNKLDCINCQLSLYNLFYFQMILCVHFILCILTIMMRSFWTIFCIFVKYFLQRQVLERGQFQGKLYVYKYVIYLYKIIIVTVFIQIMSCSRIVTRPEKKSSRFLIDD